MPEPLVNLPACGGPKHFPWSRDQERLSERIHLFGRRLKSLGVPVTISGIRDALRSLVHVDVTRKADFEIALGANLVSRKEDLGLFEAEFERFWGSLARPDELEPPGVTGLMKSSDLAEPGRRGKEVIASPRKAGVLFSRAEGLAEKDFKDWNTDDWQQVSLWVDQWITPLVERISPRYRPARQGSTLEIRKMLRQSLRVGGDFMALTFRRKKVKPRRLIFLADVSASMEPYGRFFFLFLQAWLKAPFPAELFAFSTRLTYLTPLIKSRKMEEVGEIVSRHVPQWSSGTRIGESLEQFLRIYGKRLLGTRSLVLVFSDGWDLGEPEVLRGALSRIRRRSHKILWLNPLMGCPDYQPICRGMAAALPYLDGLLPSHTVSAFIKTLKQLREWR